MKPKAATARPKVSPLKSHLGYWMRLVSNQVSHTFARKLEASGVTVAEWVILREMAEGGITSPSTVAALTGLTRGAVSKLVDRLLQKGLVSRRASAGDRRFQEIELTAAALGLLPKLGSLADQNDDEFFGVLPAAERRALKRLLIQVAQRHSLSHPPLE